MSKSTHNKNTKPQRKILNGNETKGLKSAQGENLNIRSSSIY